MTISVPHLSRYSKQYNMKHRILLLCITFVLCSFIMLITKLQSLSGIFNANENIRLFSERNIPIVHNDPTCITTADKWIVITTIFYPTPAIYKFLNLITEWNLVIIADRKTPQDWLQRLNITSTRLLFVSLEQQKNLSFQILQHLPYGSYARKNLGYLLAIKCGAEIIFESDDDNLLDTNDIFLLPKVVQPPQVPWIAFHRQRSPFINIYGSFGHPQIWPRGFPIDELRNLTEDGWHSVRQNTDQNTNAYIQQYLADLDPDVDAIVSFLSSSSS